MPFNSLFEMPCGPYDEEEDADEAYLSILYLRCGSTPNFAAISGVRSFNSLFEMRIPWDVAMMLAKISGEAFNSLFEMLQFFKLANE